MKKIYLLLSLLSLFLCKLNAQLVVFSDDYAAGVSFAAFGGSVNTLSIDASQHHSGTASLKIPVTTGYTGGALVAATAQDLSMYNALTFWAKNDMPSFKLDGVGIANNAVTTVFACERNGVSLSATWTKYYIPIPVASKLTAETGLFHFAEGSGEGAYNIWIDDIQYENVTGGIIGTPTAAIATETQAKEVGATFSPNGCTSTYPVNSIDQQMQTSKAFFTWTTSPTGIASFDATGTGTALAPGSTSITGKLGAVNAAGTLTLNVTAVVAPTIAAPTPTTVAADVKSLFSGAYTNIPVETWSTSWSSCCNTLTDLQIAGNATKKYDLFHFAGVEFINTGVDGTVYDKMHIDVWTPETAKPFSIRLVDFNGAHSEADVTKTPASKTWVSYDIPLSDFTTLAGKSKLSQILFLVAPNTTGTFFIDNVYFYKSGSVPPPTVPTVAAPTPPARSAGDVISLFSGAYTDLGATNWFPDWGQTTVVSELPIATNPTKKYVNFNFQGVQFASAINASGMSKLHIDIWTPTAITFDVFPIVPGQPEAAKSLIPTVAGWNSYDIDLATIGTAPLSNIIQFKFVGTPAGSTVYLDNIYFWKGFALPVTLTDFKADKRGTTNVLSWATSSEINSKAFIAERSGNGIDWATVQSVDASGSTNANTQYSAIDNSPLRGINYYRIKLVDRDGKFTYSKIVALNGSLGIKNFTVFPNPFATDVKVSFTSETVSMADFRILSLDGKSLINRKMSIQKGDNIVVLKDLENLSKGNYILEVTTPNDKLIQKISKN
jgi:hypothetical protein